MKQAGLLDQKQLKDLVLRYQGLIWSLWPKKGHYYGVHSQEMSEKHTSLHWHMDINLLLCMLYDVPLILINF